LALKEGRLGDQAITPYPEIDALLNHLLDQIRQVLGEKLVALYLYGSLVTGDFDREISDIDLLAATASDIEAQEFERLQQMHYDVVAKSPEWDGRLEIAYLSVAALKTFRTQVSQIAVISPGEPFHFKEAGKDWLVNWWVVQEKGVTLFDPPLTALIEPISREEFLQTVQEHTQAWGEWVNQMQDLPGQAYAILTLCRSLYTAKTGEQVSKKEAALWAQASYPQWAWLIQKALVWRTGGRDEATDQAATFFETVNFVHFAIEQIVLKKPEGDNSDEIT
jgi:predicted nucleotidyltransferase